MSGQYYDGAATNRLMGGWATREVSPDQTWQIESGELSARAANLVRNDPVSAALLQAKLIGTHGANGLRLRSLAEVEDDNEGTSELRDEIEAELDRADYACNLDASGQLSRRSFDEALDELATVEGESFAVRAWLPDRPQATTGSCWRLIRKDRVCNPPGKQDGKNLYQGFALGRDGAPVGIWIAPADRMPGGSMDAKTWQYVPWYDANGLPSIIHRIGKRIPGGYRGISMFAVNLPLAKQLKNLLEAYVVAKRIQACHPIFIKCEDPVAAAKKDRNGAVWGPNTTLEPGKVYYIGENGDITMPSFKFEGADLREFIDTNYRNSFAAWGMPIDVVLAQLGETNMAASRSAWLQYYRQCERWQQEHIAQVRAPMDAVIIAEGIAAGRIDPRGMELRDLVRGRYLRPPRAMPDPLKEAMAVKAWAELGRDLTGLWAESGVDFRESVMQRHEDDEWRMEYGYLEPATTAENPDPAPVETPEDPAEQQDQEDTNDTGNQEVDDAPPAG